MNENAANKHLWIGVGKQVLSFVVGVIAAAFILGGARQRINDVYQWKTEVAPRIERMDSKGTLSFEHFHQEYMRTQTRQEEKIKELDHQVTAIQRQFTPNLEDRLKFLESEVRQRKQP